MRALVRACATAWALASPFVCQTAWAEGTTPTSWGSEGGAVSIKMNAPAGLVALPEDSLPQLQLDGVPGGKTILRRGVGKPGAEQRVMALCVQASSSMWAPDLEATVFDRLHDTIKQELERKGSVDRFDPGRPLAVPPRFEASLGADVAVFERGKPRPLDTSLVPRVRVAARSSLGFAGKDADLVVCSVVCSELATDVPGCGAVLSSTSFVGSFVPAPTPSVGARVAGSFLRAPLSTLGLIVGLACFGLGAVVAAWPPRRKAIGSSPDPDADTGPDSAND